MDEKDPPDGGTTVPSRSVGRNQAPALAEAGKKVFLRSKIYERGVPMHVYKKRLGAADFLPEGEREGAKKFLRGRMERRLGEIALRDRRRGHAGYEDEG